MFEYILFITLLLIVLVIVIQSFIIGISPMPTSKKVALEMVKLLENSSKSTIVDLGSGFGSLAIYLAVQFPKKRIVGYELSFFAWLISYILKHLLNLKNLELYRKNYLILPFEEAFYVCYLFPKGMEKLLVKIKKESTSIEVLSSTFAFRNEPIYYESRVDDIYHTPLYWYKF